MFAVRSRPAPTALLLCAATLGLSLMSARPAEAKKKLPPDYVFVIKKAAKKGGTLRKVGTDELRGIKGEANEAGVKKRYISTVAQLRDKGRRFKQRTHMVLDGKGHLMTVDRWVDVKGATARRRVFSFKGKWKIVVYPVQRGDKRELVELDTEAPFVVLDPRSPTLAIAALGKIGDEAASFRYVRLDEKEAGTLKVERRTLTTEDGKATYTEVALVAPKFRVEVLHDADGPVRVRGLESYVATAQDVKIPAKLVPAAANPAPVAAEGNDDVAKPAGDATDDTEIDAPPPPPPPAAGDTPPAPAAEPSAPPAKPTEPSKPSKPAKPAVPSDIDRAEAGDDTTPSDDDEDEPPAEALPAP